MIRAGGERDGQEGVTPNRGGGAATGLAGQFDVPCTVGVFVEEHGGCSRYEADGEIVLPNLDSLWFSGAIGPWLSDWDRNPVPDLPAELPHEAGQGRQVAAPGSPVCARPGALTAAARHRGDRALEPGARRLGGQRPPAPGHDLGHVWT